MRTMARKRKARVTLPWEERGAWLRDLILGRRWRAVVVGMLLVGAAFLMLQSAQRRARVRETRVAITEVKRAIAAFRGEMGRCPRSTVELVHPPSPATRHLSAMPRDAWGRDLHVRCPGRYDSQEADVISAGPSGSFFIDDNVQ
jgi:type II secretory pathway pseudopilin PulG